MERAAMSLFLVASKSGATIEVSTLAAEAERRVQAAHVTEPGSRFVAITDENTPLHRRALDRRFREVFINPADVGGRFSALTLFGLVPAALMGIDLDALLASAQSMADACRDENPRRNPGLALGAALAAAAVEGRDKLRLAMPPRLERFGLWIEQLVAESTGKQGKGIVPIVGERADAVPGDDRIVVAIAPVGATHASPLRNVPCVRIEMPDVSALGAEFFRWEVATATAGFLLDINPFDEPNVQQAKDATRVLLATYSTERRLPLAEPHAAIDGVRVAFTAAAKDALAGGTPPTLRRVLHPRDYAALLAYLPPEDARFAPILEELRTAVATTTGCATMLGYGPRYLHSTGQLYKGGPNTGVFIIVTADPPEDLPVPGEPYSFGMLEMAQAVGDFQALGRAGRRAAHVHLPRRDPALLQRVCEHLLRA
jgi:glucose-6-phosphate isomerase/transaldolase/glucose-6-phosphate isomerase